jgi:hypothetical protein
MCTPGDVSVHIRDKFTKLLLNFGATHIYLVNESSSVCIIEGRPVLSGIAADGSEFQLTNKFSCLSVELICARRVVDEPIALYPQSETDPRRPHAASIEIAFRGSIPDFCEDPIPWFQTLRVSWPQGEIDVHRERGFSPCEPEIYVYWFQPSDLPSFLQSQ